jgi:hypothetical protein
MPEEKQGYKKARGGGLPGAKNLFLDNSLVAGIYNARLSHSPDEDDLSQTKR